MRLTASKVGLARECGFWLDPAVECLPREPGKAAIEGTRVHTLIEHDDGSFTTEPAVLTARKYIETIGNRPMQKEPAYAWDGQSAPKQIGTGRECYADAPEGIWVVAGTVDLLTNLAPRRWRVTDWKNGERGTEKAEEQLRILAAMVVACHGGECEMHAVWLQGDGEPTDYGTMTEMEADGWLESLRTIPITEAQPGDHCSSMYCPLEGRCPAYDSAAALVPVGALTVRRNPLTTAVTSQEMAVDLHRMIGMVEGLLKSKEEELRAYVTQHHGGKLPLGNGQVWGPISCKGRSGVDGDGALALASSLGASKEDLARLVKTGAAYQRWAITGKKSA